jgi:hypothetical protein
MTWISVVWMFSSVCGGRNALTGAVPGGAREPAVCESASTVALVVMLAGIILLARGEAAERRLGLTL